MIVEAVRKAGGAAGPMSAQTATPAADPQAVDAFNKAMGVEGPTDIPFASKVSAAWRAAQVDQQDVLHRMTKLSELANLGGASVAQMSQLQYEVANFAFQQEIVTSIAKKASDGITTLIKNQ